MAKRLGIVLVVVVVIAAIVVCAVPLMEVSYAVDVPYEDVETYWEKEPFTESVPIDYRVTDTGIYNWFWTTGSDVWVTIKNADVKSGYFRVSFDLVTRGGARITKTASKYIAIGEEEEVEVYHSGDNIKTFSYSVTPPSKDVTVWKDVKKQRTVTRIREETRYKDVTVLEYLTKY